MESRSKGFKKTMSQEVKELESVKSYSRNVISLFHNQRFSPSGHNKSVIFVLLEAAELKLPIKNEVQKSKERKFSPRLIKMSSRHIIMTMD